MAEKAASVMLLGSNRERGRSGERCKIKAVLQLHFGALGWLMGRVF